MNPEPPSTPSIPGLLRELRDETSHLLRQEIALARTEFKANISSLGHNAVQIAIGGFVAYAGIIVLLIGLGHLLGAVLIRAGLSEDLAQWFAPVVLGGIVAAIGWMMLSKAKQALSATSLKPRETIESLKTSKEWAQQKLSPS